MTRTSFGFVERILRCTCGAIALSAFSGCAYVYNSAISQPPVGSHVRVSVSPGGTQIRLRDGSDTVLVGGVRRIEGTVVENSNGMLGISVKSMKRRGGVGWVPAITTRGNTVSVRPTTTVALVSFSDSQIAGTPVSISKRQFSTGRTFALTAGTVALGFGFYYALVHLAAPECGYLCPCSGCR